MWWLIIASWCLEQYTVKPYEFILEKFTEDFFGLWVTVVSKPWTVKLRTSKENYYGLCLLHFEGTKLNHMLSMDPLPPDPNHTD